LNVALRHSSAFSVRSLSYLTLRLLGSFRSEVVGLMEVRVTQVDEIRDDFRLKEGEVLPLSVVEHEKMSNRKFCEFVYGLEGLIENKHKAAKSKFHAPVLLIL